MLARLGEEDHPSISHTPVAWFSSLYSQTFRIWYLLRHPELFTTVVYHPRDWSIILSHTIFSTNKRFATTSQWRTKLPHSPDKRSSTSMCYNPHRSQEPTQANRIAQAPLPRSGRHLRRRRKHPLGPPRKAPLPPLQILPQSTRLQDRPSQRALRPSR